MIESDWEALNLEDGQIFPSIISSLPPRNHSNLLRAESALFYANDTQNILSNGEISIHEKLSAEKKPQKSSNGIYNEVFSNRDIFIKMLIGDSDTNRLIANRSTGKVYIRSEKIDDSNKKIPGKYLGTIDISKLRDLVCEHSPNPSSEEKNISPAPASLLSKVITSCRLFKTEDSIIDENDDEIQEMTSPGKELRKLLKCGIESSSLEDLLLAIKIMILYQNNSSDAIDTMSLPILDLIEILSSLPVPNPIRDKLKLKRMQEVKSMNRLKDKVSFSHISKCESGVNRPHILNNCVSVSSKSKIGCTIAAFGLSISTGQLYYEVKILGLPSEAMDKETHPFRVGWLKSDKLLEERLLNDANFTKVANWNDWGNVSGIKSTTELSYVVGQDSLSWGINGLEGSGNEKNSWKKNDIIGIFANFDDQSHYYSVNGVVIKSKSSASSYYPAASLPPGTKVQFNFGGGTISFSHPPNGLITQSRNPSDVDTTKTITTIRNGVADTRTVAPPPVYSVSDVAESHCLQFNPQSSLKPLPDCVIVRDTPIGLSICNFTIGALIKLNASSSKYHTIVSSGKISDSGFEFGIQVDGSLVFHIYGGKQWMTRAGVVPNKKWTHVTVSFYKRSNIMFYVNGRQSALREYSNATNIPDFVGTFIIGCRWHPQLDSNNDESNNDDSNNNININIEEVSSLASTAFIGEIADVRLWSAALSHSEIQGVLYRSMEHSNNLLLSQWKFNEGVGYICHDAACGASYGIIRGCNWKVIEIPSLLDSVSCLEQMETIATATSGGDGATRPDNNDTFALNNSKPSSILKQIGGIDTSGYDMLSYVLPLPSSGATLLSTTASPKVGNDEIATNGVDTSDSTGHSALNSNVMIDGYPKEVIHAKHHHPLLYVADLGSLHRDYGGSSGSFRCDICDTNGIAPLYHCDECRFDAHIGCAYIPGVTKVFEFSVGNRIEAMWAGNHQYYQGIISARHESDGTYDINYDDGDKETHVHSNYIRNYGENACTSNRSSLVGHESGLRMLSNPDIPCFDTKSVNVNFKKNNLIAHCTSNGKSHAMVNQGFIKGKAWWELKLLKDKTGDGRICLGAGIKPVMLSDYDKSKELWVLRPYSGGLYARGKYIERKLSPKPLEGDIVRFELDCDAHTLSIKHNGKDHGVCFKDLPNQPIYPTVSFYGRNRECELVGCGVMYDGTASETGLDVISEMMEYDVDGNSAKVPIDLVSLVSSSTSKDAFIDESIILLLASIDRLCTSDFEAIEVESKGLGMGYGVELQPIAIASHPHVFILLHSILFDLNQKLEALLSSTESDNTNAIKIKNITWCLISTLRILKANLQRLIFSKVSFDDVFLKTHNNNSNGNNDNNNHNNNGIASYTLVNSFIDVLLRLSMVNQPEKNTLLSVKEISFHAIDVFVVALPVFKPTNKGRMGLLMQLFQCSGVNDSGSSNNTATTDNNTNDISINFENQDAVLLKVLKCNPEFVLKIVEKICSTTDLIDAFFSYSQDPTWSLPRTIRGHNDNNNNNNVSNIDEAYSAFSMDVLWESHEVKNGILQSNTSDISASPGASSVQSPSPTKSKVIEYLNTNAPISWLKLQPVTLPLTVENTSDAAVIAVYDRFFSTFDREETESARMTLHALIQLLLSHVSGNKSASIVNNNISNSDASIASSLTTLSSTYFVRKAASLLLKSIECKVIGLANFVKTAHLAFTSVKNSNLAAADNYLSKLLKSSSSNSLLLELEKSKAQRRDPLHVAGAVESEEPIFFDYEKCDLHIQLNPDNTSAKLVSAPRSWCCVALRRGISPHSGIYSIQFKIGKLSMNKRICIGLVSNDKATTSATSSTSQLVGMSEHSFGWCFTGQRYSNGSMLRVPMLYGPHTHIHTSFTNQSIYMVYNSNTGTLSFGNSTKGEDFGVAFNDILQAKNCEELELFPAISLFDEGDFLTVDSLARHFDDNNVISISSNVDNVKGESITGIHLESYSHNVNPETNKLQSTLPQSSSILVLNTFTPTCLTFFTHQLLDRFAVLLQHLESNTFKFFNSSMSEKYDYLQLNQIVCQLDASIIRNALFSDLYKPVFVSLCLWRNIKTEDAKHILELVHSCSSSLSQVIDKIDRLYWVSLHTEISSEASVTAETLEHNENASNSTTNIKDTSINIATNNSKLSLSLTEPAFDEVKVASNRILCEFATILGLVAGTLVRSLTQGCRLNKNNIPENASSTSAGSNSSHKDKSTAEWCTSRLVGGGLRSLSNTSSISLDDDSDNEGSFHQDLINNSGVASALNAWIFRHAGTKQMILRTGGADMNRAMRSVIAALLYHTGYLTLAKKTADAIEYVLSLTDIHDDDVCGGIVTFNSNSTSNNSSNASFVKRKISEARPSSILIEIWKKAVDIKQWGVFYFQKHRNNDNNDITYKTVATMIEEKSEFLCNLVSCTPHNDVMSNELARKEYLRLVKTFVMLDSNLKDSHSSTSSLLEAITSSESESPKTITRRQVKPAEEQTWLAMGRTTRVLSLSTEGKQRTIELICKFMKDNDVSVSQIQDALCEARSGAETRINGYEKAQRILTSIGSHHLMQSCRSAFLLQFINDTVLNTEAFHLQLCNSSSSLVGRDEGISSEVVQREHPRHYSDEIDGCGWVLMDKVKKSFFDYNALLARYLRTIDPIDNPDITLILLKSWEIVIQARDHAFISQLNIFQSLQNILQTCRDSIREMYHMRSSSASVLLSSSMASDNTSSDAFTYIFPPSTSNSSLDDESNQKSIEKHIVNTSTSISNSSASTAIYTHTNNVTSVSTKAVKNQTTTSVLTSKQRMSVTIIKAAIKLVIFLASQIAVETTPAVSNVSQSLAPIKFTRVASGPDTLSKYVFDILFVELEYAVSGGFFSESLEIVEDICTVLVAVGNNTKCQKFLGTSEWLALLLQVCCSGHIKIQRRLMRLFRKLLPYCDTDSFSTNLPFRIHGEFENVNASTLVYFFLVCAGVSLAPFEKKSNLKHLPEGKATFALASSILETLLLLLLSL